MAGVETLHRPKHTINRTLAREKNNAENLCALKRITSLAGEIKDRRQRAKSDRSQDRAGARAPGADTASGSAVALVLGESGPLSGGANRAGILACEQEWRMPALTGAHWGLSGKSARARYTRAGENETGDRYCSAKSRRQIRSGRLTREQGNQIRPAATEKQRAEENSTGGKHSADQNLQKQRPKQNERLPAAVKSNK
jgi:hypothetical protein